MNNKSKLLKIIPSNWELKRIKNIGKVNGGLTYSPDDIVDFDSNGAILVLRSSNIQEGKISYLDNVYVNVKVNKKQMTTIGDILICSRNGSRRLLGKNILIDEYSQNLAFGAFMTILRTKYNKFVRYYLASGVFNDLLNSSTSTINQLTTRDINNIEIPLPSLIEQEKIVTFLDNNCYKIDNEVDLLEKKSILLDEYKNALIYETVTKGLDTNAEMKDSGVEWMGDVPSHWNIRRIKSFVKSLKTGKEDASHSDEDGIYDFYTCSVKNFKCKDFKFEGSAILLAGNGDISNIKHLKDEKSKFNAYQRVYILQKIRNNERYLYYSFKAGFFNSVRNKQKGSVIEFIKLQDITNFEILDFDINEQAKISNFLDTKQACG